MAINQEVRLSSCHNRLLVLVEHGLGMTLVQGRTGLILVKFEPVAGGSVTHAVAWLGEDADFAG